MKPYALPLLVTLLLVNSTARTDDAFQSDDISWLYGCWQGQGLGGHITECWVPSGQHRATGFFQLMVEEKQQFSEIFMLAEFDQAPGLRVKHFDHSFNQWESDHQTGHTFAFTSIGENFIQFDGLRYELVDGRCHISLDLNSEKGADTVNFVLDRVKQATGGELPAGD